jgi:hypothetical protein
VLLAIRANPGEHDPEAAIRLREPQPGRSRSVQHLQLLA